MLLIQSSFLIKVSNRSQFRSHIFNLFFCLLIQFLFSHSTLYGQAPNYLFEGQILINDKDFDGFTLNGDGKGFDSLDLSECFPEFRRYKKYKIISGGNYGNYVCGSQPVKLSVISNGISVISAFVDSIGFEVNLRSFNESLRNQFGVHTFMSVPDPQQPIFKCESNEISIAQDIYFYTTSSTNLFIRYDFGITTGTSFGTFDDCNQVQGKVIVDDKPKFDSIDLRLDQKLILDPHHNGSNQDSILWSSLTGSISQDSNNIGIYTPTTLGFDKIIGHFIDQSLASSFDTLMVNVFEPLELVIEEDSILSCPFSQDINLNWSEKSKSFYTVQTSKDKQSWSDFHTSTDSIATHTPQASCLKQFEIHYYRVRDDFGYYSNIDSIYVINNFNLSLDTINMLIDSFGNAIEVYEELSKDTLRAVFIDTTIRMFSDFTNVKNINNVNVGPQRDEMNFDDAGNLYSCNSNSLYKHDKDTYIQTQILGQFGSGTAPNQISRITDFVIADSTTIFIVDFNLDRVVKWNLTNSTGDIIYTKDKPSHAYLKNNFLYVTNQSNHSVDRINLNDNSVVQVASGFNRPADICVDDFDNIYLIDGINGSKRIHRINVNSLNTTILVGSGWLSELGVDDIGNLTYFTSGGSSNATLWRRSPFASSSEKLLQHNGIREYASHPFYGDYILTNILLSGPRILARPISLIECSDVDSSFLVQYSHVIKNQFGPMNTATAIIRDTISPYQFRSLLGSGRL